MVAALAKYWLLTSVVETDSNSGVTWTKEKSKKEQPFAIFLLLTSVGETNADSGATRTEKKR